MRDVNDHGNYRYKIEGCVDNRMYEESFDTLYNWNDKGDEEAYKDCDPKIIHSPNGGVYWIPVVPVNIKPVVGVVYASFEEAKKTYECYADKGGFSTRLNAVKRKRGEITHRYIVYNKYGKSKSVSADTLKAKEGGTSRRMSKFKVTNCKAGVKFKVIPGTSEYCLYKFFEAHNHNLMEDDDKEFSKARRKLQYADKRYILKLSTSNIGPSIAYRLRTLSSGGHSQVNGTVDDFRNFRRHMNLFIGSRDAQMLIDRMTNRKKNRPHFTFEYKTDVNEVVLMFWADEIAKSNFDAFGDVLAFDATYQTNRYKMVFVPFTGVDHHTRSVTFGGALIKIENTESYKWILESFLEAHGKPPKLVLTDQDPAVKIAIEATLPQSVHRLCMWHIMDKLPVKISGDILANTDLRKRINKLVWNTYLTPSEFEEGWRKMIDELNLCDNKWLHDMFEIRERWIPGYFRDLPMCCLMKITSRSESCNAFFRRYANPENTLLQFMVCFETAMDDQRYNQKKLDNETMNTTPSFMTHLKVERYAAKLYTHEVFKNVQKEIFKGDSSCAIRNFTSKEGCDLYTVMHNDKNMHAIDDFKVTKNNHTGEWECSCLNFGRIGFLCRHIIYVFKYLDIHEIPEPYALRRWRADALSNISCNTEESNLGSIDERE